MDFNFNAITRFLKESPPNPHCCCLCFTEQGLSVVVGEISLLNKVQIKAVEFFPKLNLANANETLSEVVSRWNLKKAPTSLVLNYLEYQLFILEPLPVLPHEMQAALRWRIRELINYPAAEAAWDYAEVPLSEDKNQIDLVVAKLGLLESYRNLLKLHKLNLKIIDVADFSLCRLLSLNLESALSVGCLHVQSMGFHLILIKNNSVYLSRQINLSPTENHLEELALEVQRSFDYFQSATHFPAPQVLYLTSDNDTMIDALQKNLSCRLEVISLMNLLSGYLLLEDGLKTEGLLALGGILRL